MNITIRPHILKELREQRRIPISVAAKKLKMDLEEYQSYESHERDIPRSEAQRIAKVFRHNWTVFLLKEPPPRINFGNDNRQLRQVKAGVSLRTYEALEDAYHLLDFIIDIKAGEQIPAIPEIEHAGSPKALADIFRKSVNIQEEHPRFTSQGEALNFWVGKVESLDVNISKFPLDDGDGVRAFSIFKQGSAIIVLNSRDTQTSMLFSLLHEVAHVLRRNTGLCDLHRDEKIESYCNEFAAEVLIPSKLYHKLVANMAINDDTALAAAEKIARRFKVSRLSVLTRLLKDERITQNKYDELYRGEIDRYKDIASKRQAKNSTGFAHPYTTRNARVGRLFINEIFNALKRSRINIFEASKHLGVRPASIDKFHDYINQ